MQADYPESKGGWQEYLDKEIDKETNPNAKSFLLGKKEGRKEMLKRIEKFMREHTCSNISSTSEGTCIDTSFVKFPCFVWADFKRGLEK